MNSNQNDCKDLQKIITPEIVDGFRLSRKKKGVKYYEVACAFDIETSSFYEDGEKRACMYVWQFGIDGHVFMGRTWYQFRKLINEVSELFALGDDLRLCCYVHNLAYEFQFMRKWFEWEKVFAIKSRTPVYALCIEGIEFRCSYLLSGYSLAKLSDQLTRYKVEKKVGDLDYSLIRHSKTPLTEKEIGYCVNDVLVVMAYVQEKIETDGSIIKIPLTKTGYVRNICREACFKSENSKKSKLKRWRYNNFMRGLTIDPQEFNSLKWAFMGGFTHAGAFYSGSVVEDVTSYDFTSSYPYVLISEQYPMGKGERITIKSDEEFFETIKYYACVFDVEFWDLDETFIYDHYISLSRCYMHEGAETDNGRVISAKHVRMTITEQDYLIIRKTYTWSKCIIRNFYRYTKGYLPTDIVKTILKLYAIKTRLKNVPQKEAEYLAGKEAVNSMYGMMVTSPVRPINEYGPHGWFPERMPNVEEELNRYNNSYSRFTYVPWGIFCTAYARRNLWTGILEFGEDYVYSDTDSIKAVNIADHMDYINRYNENVRKKLEVACRYHKIDISETEPETIKGVKKPLGVWDFDGHYKRFKTLGAKRYMIENDNGINITVSGLNKRVTVPFLCDGWCSDICTHEEHASPFEKFSDGLYVPAEYTGKSTHTYIDEPHRGKVRDYMGTVGTYYEKTCVHMEGAEYSLSISQEYINFLLGLEEIEGE